MTKIETYRQVLKTLADWEPYLLQESGLPGPRGNWNWLRSSPMKAPGTCLPVS
jgi:hypothetical protein